MEQYFSYKDARNNISDGDIVFIKNKQSFVAAGIRFFTRSLYSHVGFAFWVEIAGKKRLMMAEAQGGAHRRIVNMSFYSTEELDVISAPKDWDTIADCVLEKLGEVSYGWLEAAFVGLRETILKVFNINIPSQDMPGEICSEYVATKLNLPKKHVSPQLLYEQLISLGHDLKIQIKRK